MCRRGKKTDFRAKIAFRQNVKTAVSRNSSRDQVWCQCRSFFCGLDRPTKFHWPQSKTKGTCNKDFGLARNSQNSGWVLEKDPYLGTGKFLQVGTFFGWAPGILVICPSWQKIAILKQKIDFWPQLSKFLNDMPSWFSNMRVPEVLLPLKIIRMFGPKTAIFAPKYAFLGTYRPCLFIWCCWLVGRWLWCKGCISQDTYLFYLLAVKEISKKLTLMMP